MADEQGAPVVTEGGSAAATTEGGSAAAPVQDTSATNAETPEQKAERLEAALAEERRLRLKREQEARDLREAAARPQPAPTNGQPDPYAVVHQRIKDADAILQQFPNDIATQAARDLYAMQLQAMQQNAQQQQVNAWLKSQRDAVNESAEPDAIKTRALQMIEQGIEAPVAIAAAHGERAKQTESARAQADALAAAQMRDKPNTSVGSSTPTAHGNVVSLSEYNRRVDAGDSKLMADVDAGRVRIDYAR